MREDHLGAGTELHALCKRLYPFIRSITGNGVRDTLQVLGEYLPLRTHEVPSGTDVFDWTVPPEWNVREAYISDQSGRRVVDLKDHSLHVMSYSVPVRERMSLAELQAHLFSLPDHPDWIPYRTSYYQRGWGFCLKDSERRRLSEGSYDVVIDALLEQGSLTYGELYVPGRSTDEVLIAAHVCHPSLANDNLSGIAVATFLARRMVDLPTPPTYSYRFIFVPSTIGAITWLAQNEPVLNHIVAGMVLSGIGDQGTFTYKRSRRGDAMVDRAFERALRKRNAGRVEPFTPYGYDERQFCSPGIDLPVGCLMRTPYGQYPEYHTSADNLDFIRPESLGESLSLCIEVIDDLDHAKRYRNLSPKCEPQLGRRGLYDAIGGENDKKAAQLAMLWLLNYSDGLHSVIDISEMSGLSLAMLERAAIRLHEAKLLVSC